MDPALKAKWIEALRSGEFKQGTEKLHDPQDDSFCCLGVLCKIMGAEFGEAVDGEANEWSYVPHLNGRVLSKGENEELADYFCEEVGIPDQCVLIVMNDGTMLGVPQDHKPPLPFPEIADYIEENL